MVKIWAGRSSGEIDHAADDFNSSIRFDSRMYREDITGSIAHAHMLGARGIISPSDMETVVEGLTDILEGIENGTIKMDPNAEDIHSFIEAELTRRVGEPGKRLHTARSRNDQVALDIRLYLRRECAETQELLKKLVRTLCDKAEKYSGTVMPGYTHMQRAQPVTFGHHLMAYVMMFMRDIGRLEDAAERMNVSPIGCCALAGTTYDTDRAMEASELGFSDIAMNSLDGVSDRDFCVELCAALSLIMTHLSRFSEEIILWASWEFKFIELSDAYSTGSSIMPQKKNPDMAELCRGKTGRVYGDLMALLTVLKGIPLAYNKDMQEDKEAIFDAFDTVKACLGVFSPMVATMTVNADKMRAAAAGGFINATDLADYLVGKGMPFRTAYKLVGGIVAECVESGRTLETLELEAYKKHSELFGEDLYTAIDIDECVKRRISAGGPTESSVKEQIDYVLKRLK
ncbi:MAG: argininosuccinate lyase [Oscillospiraceae bacterium]